MGDLGNTEVAKMSKGSEIIGAVPTGARYTSMGVEFGSPAPNKKSWVQYGARL